MGFDNKYPYTDFHELNLDWILEQMKNLAAAWDAYQEQLTGENGEWPTFKNYIETSWATYQNNLTGPTGEWPTFKAYMENAWQLYQDSLTGVGGEWPTFKATMEGEWQQFFDTYLQTLGVTQSVSLSVTDVMSQKGLVENYQRIGIAGKDNLINSNIISFNKYHDGTGFINYNLYSAVTIPVTSGTTYYIYPSCRFISKDGTMISQNHTTPTSYTADFTGNLYVSFWNSSPDWIITTSSSYDNVAPFNVPSFFKNALKQTTGSSERVPMSQKATTDAIDDVKSSVSELQKRYAINMVNPYTTTAGFLQSDGTISTVGAYAGYKTSDYIKVSPGQTLTLGRITKYGQSVNLRLVIAEFDNNNSIIAGTYLNIDNQTSITITTTANTSYVRCSAQIAAFDYSANDYLLVLVDGNSMPKSFIPFNLTMDIESITLDQFNEDNTYNLVSQKFFTEQFNPLLNKKVLNLGDSISENRAGSISYSKQLCDTMGCVLTTDYAVSGATISYVTDQVMGSVWKQAVQAVTDHPSENYDIILVEGGANDYGNLRTVGDVVGTAGVYTQADYSAAFDTTTYIGALEETLKTLREGYIDSIIIFVIPHKHMRLDATWVEMLDKARTACAKWSVDVLDIDKYGELNTRINDMRIYTDAGGTHPNTAGIRKYYVPELIAKLKKHFYNVP